MVQQVKSQRLILRLLGIAIAFGCIGGCNPPDSKSVSKEATVQKSAHAVPPEAPEVLRKQVSTVPTNVDVVRDIQYAEVGGVGLLLDLYLPRDRSNKGPLLVWIHGGGWSEGRKDWCPLIWMSGHGYAVASIQYRLSGQAPFPAQVHDCKGAIRWLRAHADDYGYKRSKVGVAGESAGGQLAALVGTSGDVKELEGEVGGNLDQSSRVQAVIDMCGTSDFLLILEDFPEYSAKVDSNTARLFGGPLTEKQELGRLASSVHHVTKDDPPLMILHGENDPLVSLKQSQRLRDRYQTENLNVSFCVIPGGAHVPPELWDKTHQTLMLEFLNKHLKVKN